jgi:hypothetical protein
MLRPLPGRRRWLAELTSACLVMALSAGCDDQGDAPPDASSDGGAQADMDVGVGEGHPETDAAGLDARDPAEYEWTRLVGYPGQWQLAGHEAMEFGGRLWVMGGLRGGSSGIQHNDVWSTSDGLAWTEATPAAAWSGRSLFGAAAFAGAMWVIDGARKADVWRSVDGVTWTEQPQAPFPARHAHQVAVFHDRLYVMAGEGPSGEMLDDVWSSADGQAWRLENAHAEFGPRQAAEVVVLPDRMLLIGGYGPNNVSNDIWSSHDGVHWTQVTAAAPFARRQFFAAAWWEGRIFVISGGGYGGEALTDVWSSGDGQEWTRLPDLPWKPGSYHIITVTPRAGALWVVGPSGVHTLKRRMP